MSVFDEWANVGPLVVDFMHTRRGGRRARGTFRSARAAPVRIIRKGQHEGVFRPEPPNALATTVLASLDGLFLPELVEPGCTRAARADLHDSVVHGRRYGDPS